MIRKFISRIFRQAPSGETSAEHPLTIPRKTHGIGRDHISACAVKTTRELQRAGYAAYVVGGAVRDLALGRTPKDFDVATDATPEEVRRLFRRSRIIGRRFRLVHVLCGQETVEVSTFRGDTQPVQAAAREGDWRDADSHADEHGRLLRDNVFGTRAQDARRRDFTVNAMFYDPTTEEILDFHGGYRDLKARVLRIIGDAPQRYREDPMRMLRAVRLAAALEMKLDAQTQAPIRVMAPTLQNVPASRLFDEMLKLLLSGHAQDGVRKLRQEGLHHGLLPMLDIILEQPLGERFVMLALKNTDERVRADKPVSPGFLFAALLWHEVLAKWNQGQATGVKSMPALHHAMDQVLAVQEQKLAIPRRFDATMREVWSMQPRFPQRSGGRPFRLLAHPRFRAAYDFLMLRCDSGETEAELGEWWKTFQVADQEERKRMLLSEPRASGRRPRRRRRKSGEPEAAGAPADNLVPEKS